jgi:hypothetical protein
MRLRMLHFTLRDDAGICSDVLELCSIIHAMSCITHREDETCIQKAGRETSENTRETFV